MQKTIIALLALLVTMPAHSAEKWCSVEYEYQGGENTSGVIHEGAVSFASTEDAVVYSYCKANCYGDWPDVDYIVGVKSCTIDGTPIEESKYKRVYEKSRSTICQITVTGKQSFYVGLSESKEECRDFMKNTFHWCKNGQPCTYTYGEG